MSNYEDNFRRTSLTMHKDTWDRIFEIYQANPEMNNVGDLVETIVLDWLERVEEDG